MAVSDIIAIIRDRAAANGVDPDTLVRFAQAESGLNPAASAGTSSGKGLFQFTDGTWKDYGRGDVFDPYANADAGARFLADNQRNLQSNGLPVTPATLYLSHFSGRKGAVDLLKAAEDAPVVSVLGNKAVQANPFLRDMTVADIRNWADRKMGGGSGTQMASAGPAMTAAPAQTAMPAAEPAAGQAGAAGGADPLLAALQSIPLGLGEQKKPMAAMPINFPQPPGIARARRMIAAMRNNPLA